MRAERSSLWLAARSGIALSDLERKLGLQADFTVADLADIADALGVAVADFVPPVRGNGKNRGDCRGAIAFEDRGAGAAEGEGMAARVGDPRSSTGMRSEACWGRLRPHQPGSVAV